MKTLMLLVTAGMLSVMPLAAADVEAVVTSSGTLTQWVPGTTFVMTEPTGPVTYYYGPKVVYATRSGTIIPEADLGTRVRLGSPVSVQYVMEGDRRLINRVVVDDDDADDDDDD